MAARSDDIPGVVSSSGILPSAAPATLEEIKRRRAIAAALASRSRPFPTTIGQGLTSLGEAFGDVMADRRLSAQEAELEKRIGVPPSAGTAAAVPAVAAPTAAPIVPPVAARPPAAPVAPVAPVVARPPAADPREAIARAVMARDGMVGPSEPQPAREVASPDPTLAGATELPQISPSLSATSSEAAATAGGDDPIWAARQSAIGGIESSGKKDPYRAIGAPTKYGRGIGRYQVVEANIAPWTQAALGQALTPQQYLASPQAQDAVFRHRFGQYVGQFGEEGAARAWFGGPGNVNKGDLTDVHKRLSIADYGKTYMEGLQANADPTRLAYASTGTATDAPPVGARGGMAIPPLTEENPVTPSDITPAPTRVAEARGVVPGAAPVMPPSRGAAPEEYRPPKPTPPAPLQRIPATEREIWARRALGINPEHPVARQVYAEEAADRKFKEDREVTRYNADVTRYEAERKEEQAWLAGAGEREDKKRARDLQAQQLGLQTQEHQQKVKLAQEAEQVRQVYGNLPAPVAKHLDESKVTATTAVQAAEAARDARIAMDNGALFGFGADAELLGHRALAKAGNENSKRIVAATQTFQSNLGPIVQQVVKGIAGRDVSTKELEFARAIAGGEISLDKDSADRILAIGERMSRQTLQSHKATVDTLLKGQPATAHPALRSLYEVREPLPGVAMPGGKPDEASSATRPIVDVPSVEEAEKRGVGFRFRLPDGRTGTVK
jgi:hypothetical protein